eukprot:scaffold137054_cov118-Phaeocystis_antarctica.AAC.1
MRCCGGGALVVRRRSRRVRRLVTTPHSPCAQTRVCSRSPQLPALPPLAHCPLSCCASPPRGPACERARLSRAEGGASGGTRACEWRGTFCTVESGTRASGLCQTPWKDNSARKFGGITIGRFLTTPHPPNSAHAWWAGGDKARLALPRRFSTSAKSVDKPLLKPYHFPPTFCILRTRRPGPC